VVLALLDDVEQFLVLGPGNAELVHSGCACPQAQGHSGTLVAVQLLTGGEEFLGIDQGVSWTRTRRSDPTKYPLPLASKY
jgi:hypothetical protein